MICSEWLKPKQTKLWAYLLDTNVCACWECSSYWVIHWYWKQQALILIAVNRWSYILNNTCLTKDDAIDVLDMIAIDKFPCRCIQPRIYQTSQVDGLIVLSSFSGVFLVTFSNSILAITCQLTTGMMVFRLRESSFFLDQHFR